MKKFLMSLFLFFILIHLSFGTLERSDNLDVRVNIVDIIHFDLDDKERSLIRYARALDKDIINRDFQTNYNFFTGGSNPYNWLKARKCTLTNNDNKNITADWKFTGGNKLVKDYLTNSVKEISVRKLPENSQARTILKAQILRSNLWMRANVIVNREIITTILIDDDGVTESEIREAILEKQLLTGTKTGSSGLAWADISIFG